ncbi:MAG: hypothetical protein EXX96DRAFT_53214 [Benjaminiella poitrasii]|nr:MAG: hypothetical protein EXX96DRAFT_53214 [Benjaminiella poitrasii]
MNKKVDLLVDEPCPELLCGICSDVLEDPIQVHCPEDHMFCSKCIQEHGEKDTRCPICLTALDKNTFQLSKFVQRQVSRLRIHCAFSANGCQWQGLISDDHIPNCKYQPRTCPNSEKGCEEINLNSSNLEGHLKACLFQTVTCPNNMPLCQPFLLKDLSKHENECQSYTCPYASEGCPFIGTLTQANIHCDHYCGRLHQKLVHLEEEVKRLNKLIQGITLGLPSTPEATTVQEDDKHQQDISMAEMDLFHQMFNSTDPFNALDLTTKSPDVSNKASSLSIPATNNNDNINNSSITSTSSQNPTATTTTTTSTINTTTASATTSSSIPAIDNSSALNDKQLASMMDLSTCLTDMSFLDNINGSSNNNDNVTTPTDRNVTTDSTDFNALLFDTATSPQPLEFIPPLSAPKRTSNGKKIRYSKNVRLAHNALRMARQRTASNNTSNSLFNPTNDAILNNLDIAKQKKNQQLTFRNMNDSTKSNKSESKSTKTTGKSNPTTPKKEKKKASSYVDTNLSTASASSPPPSSSNTTSSTPKRRPMFILASSYLSNYNNNNNEKV